MKTLFLAWQDSAATRRWFPIGRLDADVAKSNYRFGYTRGAELAHRDAGLEPLDAFPDFTEVYRSSELFPLFKNRVVTPERTDFAEYLRQLDLEPNADPLEILAVTGGTRQTDSLEIFPKIHRSPKGGFQCKFLLHGWRHVNPAAQERLAMLQPGNPLVAAIELNNPVSGVALQLETPDYYMIGWTPRYLVNDLVKAIAESPSRVSARLLQTNPVPAPAKQRYLICLQGHWPKNYEPMSGQEFQPFASPNRVAPYLREKAQVRRGKKVRKKTKR
jgi:hypothetical protein